MKKARHDYVYERNQLINELMRNKTARKQLFTKGLRLPEEIEVKMQESLAAGSEENIDIKRYENELSHF